MSKGHQKTQTASFIFLVCYLSSFSVSWDKIFQNLCGVNTIDLLIYTLSFFFLSLSPPPPPPGSGQLSMSEWHLKDIELKIMLFQIQMYLVESRLWMIVILILKFISLVNVTSMQSLHRSCVKFFSSVSIFLESV